MADVNIKVNVQTGRSSSDIKDVSKAIQSLDVSVKESSSSLKDISSVFLGGLGALVSADAVKKLAFVLAELPFEAEKLNTITNSFDALAESVGISANALKEGLVKSAGGLIDETTLLAAANKGIVALGETASRIPEILSLAKKATAVFGGEVVDNFEAINSAIAAGTTRSLRQFGIIVNADSVYTKYAKSIGYTAEQLTIAEKQTALLNAVLAKGAETLNNVDTSAKKNTKAFKELTVNIKELGETAIIAFDRSAGPAMNYFLKLAVRASEEIKNLFQSSLGKDQGEKIAAQIRVLNHELEVLQQKSGISFLDNLFGGTKSDAIEITKNKIAALKEELLKYEESQKKSASATGASTSALNSHTDAVIRYTAAQQKQLDLGKQLTDQAVEQSFKEDPQADAQRKIDAINFAEEQRKITEDNASLARETARQEANAREAEQLLAQNEVLLQLDATGNDARIAENQRRVDAILQQETLSEEKKLAIQNQVKQKEQKILDQKLAATSTFFGGITALAKTAGKEGFEIAKQTATAQATIDGIRAIQAALANPPGFPFNALIVAGVAAQTAANIINIQRQQFNKGTDYVPGIGNKDTVPALLTPGERVVPKETNKDLTRFLRDGGDTSSSEIMGAILELASRPVVVAIDGREVFYTVNDQLRGGRAFAV